MMASDTCICLPGQERDLHLSGTSSASPDGHSSPPFEGDGSEQVRVFVPLHGRKQPSSSDKVTTHSDQRPCIILSGEKGGRECIPSKECKTEIIFFDILIYFCF